MKETLPWLRKLPDAGTVRSKMPVTAVFLARHATHGILSEAYPQQIPSAVCVKRE